MNTLLQYLFIIALVITLIAGAASWYRSRLLTVTGETVSRMNPRVER